MVLDVFDNRLDVAFIGSDGVVHDQFTIAHDQDISPPGIISSQALDANTVEVLFTEPLDLTSAEDNNNYQIDGGIVVNGATLDANLRKVVLSTSSLTEGVIYTLTVTNVEDYGDGNAIPSPGIQTQFSYSIVLEQSLSFKNNVSPDSSYAGTDDTYIRETNTSANYGSEAVLLADGSDSDPDTGVTGDLATLIKWDLSEIPADATIDSATIVLDMVNSSSGSYDFFAMTTPWTESNANWNNTGSVGDRGNVIMGSIDPIPTGQIAILLNQNGVDLIQSWVNGSLENNGFILVNAGTSNGVDLISSEGATGSHPELQVNFTLPGGTGNEKPEVSFIANQSVDENQPLTVPVSAADPEGEIPVLTASNVPAFASFTDNEDGSGSLQANPGYTDSGDYVITVKATDSGGMQGSQDFTLSVININRKLVLIAINNQSVNEGETLTVPVSSSDPDGDTPALTASNVPAFASFTDNEDGSGKLDVSPGANDSGTYNITVMATDSGGLSDDKSFTLTVQDVLLPTMHIENLSISFISLPKNLGNASAQVLVHSDTGQALDNVAVTGQWSGDFYSSPSSVTVNTGFNGTASFDSIEVSRKGTGQLIFTVTDLNHDGFDHEPADDVVTSGCVTTKRNSPGC